MLIIIYPYKKVNLFLVRKKDNNIIILEKICNLKHNKDKNNTILLDCNLLTEEGLVKDFNYSLDEVFITNNITSVICINKNRIIEEICNFYKVNLISI